MIVSAAIILTATWGAARRAASTGSVCQGTAAVRLEFVSATTIFSARGAVRSAAPTRSAIPGLVIGKYASNASSAAMNAS